MRFFGFAGRKPVIVAGHSICLNHVAAHPIGALPAYTDIAEFQPRREAARPVSPLNGSYHKVDTVCRCCSIAAAY